MPARWHDPNAPAKTAQLTFGHAVNTVIWSIAVIAWIALIVKALG